MLWHDLVYLVLRTLVGLLLVASLLLEGWYSVALTRMRRRHRREDAEMEARHQREQQEIDERKVWLAAYKQGQAGYATAIREAIDDSPELIARLSTVAERMKAPAKARDLIIAKRRFEEVQGALQKQLGTYDGPDDPVLEAIELGELYPFLVEAFEDLVD